MNLIYECKFCKKQSKNKKEIFECEAAHIGLTLEEQQKWTELKENARYAGAVVSRTKNEDTEKAFTDAINALVSFEKMHGINEVG